MKLFQRESPTLPALPGAARCVRQATSTATNTVAVNKSPTSATVPRDMSIVTRVMQFAVSAVIGFGQGFQPICGFNYGAKRFDRVRGSFWFSAKLSFGVLLAAATCAMLSAPSIVELFLRGNAEVTAIGALSLRLQCVMLPFNGFLILSNMMLQTMGLAREASLVAVSRQGMFFIPAVLLLPRLLGLLGVQLAQPVGDICALVMTVPMTRLLVSRNLLPLVRSTEGMRVESEPAPMVFNGNGDLFA